MVVQFSTSGFLSVPRWAGTCTLMGNPTHLSRDNLCMCLVPASVLCLESLINMWMQVNLSLSLNTCALLLHPESLPMCRGAHALSQSFLQLTDPRRCLPHGILGNWKRKLGIDRSSEEEEEEDFKQSSKSQGDKCFSLSMLCFEKTNYCLKLHLTKGVFISPYAKIETQERLEEVEH